MSIFGSFHFHETCTYAHRNDEKNKHSHNNRKKMVTKCKPIINLISDVFSSDFRFLFIRCFILVGSACIWLPCGGIIKNCEFWMTISNDGLYRRRKFNLLLDIRSAYLWLTFSRCFCPAHDDANQKCILRIFYSVFQMIAATSGWV